MGKTRCLNRLRMGMSEITVSRWRSNKLQPSLAQLVEISRILKVEVQDLVETKYNEENTQMTEEDKIEYQ